MDGGIGLMWVDFFGGPPNPAEFGFGLFDNVRVFDGFLSGDDPDIDGDGDVDGADFLELQRTNPALIAAWEAAYPGALSAASSVPEPSTALMLVLRCCLLRRTTQVTLLFFSKHPTSQTTLFTAVVWFFYARILLRILQVKGKDVASRLVTLLPQRLQMREERQFCLWQSFLQLCTQR